MLTFRGDPASSFIRIKDLTECSKYGANMGTANVFCTVLGTHRFVQCVLSSTAADITPRYFRCVSASRTSLLQHCNICMSRIPDKWLGIKLSCFAVRVLIVADWWWWQLWYMVLSCALRLFLLQDYCVLGCETLQFDRYKRLERSCCLPVSLIVKLEARCFSEFWYSLPGMQYVASQFFTSFLCLDVEVQEFLKKKYSYIFGI